MTAHYFAYGSNMNPARMQARGMEYLALSPALLEGYRLVFNKRSHSRPQVAYANIAPAIGERVEGVIYQLADVDALRQMDAFEGTPVRYSRERLAVQTGNGPLVAWVYLANPAFIDNTLLPESNYLRHLLAGQAYLSAVYFQRLERRHVTFPRRTPDRRACVSMSECAPTPAEPILPRSDEVVDVFNALFLPTQRTCLVEGGEEPLYRPATGLGPHQVIFRADYVASALHEAAHWCIAGAHRRRLADYGYWYSPDGRDAHTQREFERVEARPQALEWLFSRAAGLPFRVSIDNLNAGQEQDSFPFRLAVWQAVQCYIRCGLPPRAELFREALARRFGGGPQPAPRDFTLGDLR